jgi:hypothetical protein
MSEKAKATQLPGAGRRNEADAIKPSGDVDPQKLKLNQQRLHVGSDHRSDAMKKGRRGTYP